MGKRERGGEGLREGEGGRRGAPKKEIAGERLENSHMGDKDKKGNKDTKDTKQTCKPSENTDWLCLCDICGHLLRAFQIICALNLWMHIRIYFHSSLCCRSICKKNARCPPYKHLYFKSGNRTIFNNLSLKWLWDCPDGCCGGQVPDLLTLCARE